MSQELQYFDCDEDGNSPEDRKVVQIPKWRQTQTQFQVDILAIFGMKYFPKNDRDIKKDLIEIERGMLPVAQIPNLNKALQDDRLVYPFPKEWVDFVIQWTKNKRKNGVLVSPRGLITFIKNKQQMISWLEKNKYLVYSKEKNFVTRPQILNRNVDVISDKSLLEVRKDASLEAEFGNRPD